MWLGTKSGDYSTKSGYYIAVDDESFRAEEIVGNGFNWTQNVLKIACPPKLKTFAWKMLKGALPVGERLIERHVEVDSKCKRCGCTESITHLFFHCPFARKVWQLAPLVTEVECSGMLDLLTIWPSLVSSKCLPPTGIVTGSLALGILWTLWKARNRFVFEGYPGSPVDTLSSATVLIKEWSNNQTPEKPVIIPTLRAEPVCPDNTMVMRSDAAWSTSQRRAGLGWVLFTSSSQLSFSKQVEFVTSPLVAEALALREAAETCRDLNLKRLRFESDSAQLIKILNSDSRPLELHGVIADILSFVAEFEFVCFVWIPRERNTMADSLAKGALNAPDVCVVVGDLIAPN